MGKWHRPGASVGGETWETGHKQGQKHFQRFGVTNPARFGAIRGRRNFVADLYAMSVETVYHFGLGLLFVPFWWCPPRFLPRSPFPKEPSASEELKAKRLKFRQDKFPLDLVQFHLLLSWHLVRFVSQLLKTLVRWVGFGLGFGLGLSLHFTQDLIAETVETVKRYLLGVCWPQQPEELFAFWYRLPSFIFLFKLPLHKCRERCCPWQLTGIAWVFLPSSPGGFIFRVSLVRLVRSFPLRGFQVWTAPEKSSNAKLPSHSILEHWLF